MKNHLGAVLATALFMSAVLAAWLAVRYYFSVSELQRLQQQYVFITNTRNGAQGLANEALEYGKRNPAIDPILLQFDLKPKPASAPAATSKPPAK